MPVTILTTAQQAAANKANIEARLNQTSPAADKAFNNVVATTEAMAYTSLYKYAADRTTANLVISATGADLDYLGSEYGIARLTAVSAVVSVTLAATDATVIPIGTAFGCQSNGLSYTAIAQTTAPYPGGTGTGVTISLSCTTAGASGNLSVGSTLGMTTPIAGAGTVATVASTVTTGADAELDPAYRGRILSYLQSLPNGSNAASYRLWAQSVAGVAKAYPYAGSPYGSGITSYPGMRTVYVKCTTAVQAQGIAPGSWTPGTQVGVGLIGQVAAAIITNQSTGIANQDLGLVPTTLYVLPITVTPIFVTITGLNVPSGLTAACQADITTALTTYLLSLNPYISGVDPIFGRNDTVSGGMLYSVVQGVLTAYGATLQSLAFGPSGGNTYSYTLNPGETLALSTPVMWS
jgi:hypothetical protein